MVKLSFISYAETHEDNTVTTMQPRTRSAICLGPTGNLNGSTRFMCIKTRMKLVRQKFYGSLDAKLSDI